MEHSPVTRKRSERLSSVTAEPNNSGAPRETPLVSRRQRGAATARSGTASRRRRPRSRRGATPCGGVRAHGVRRQVPASCRRGLPCSRNLAGTRDPHLSPDGCSSGRLASLGRAAFAGQPPAEAARALAPTVGTGGSLDSGRLPKRAGCRDSWSQHLLTPSSVVSQAAQPFCGPGS